MYLSDVSREELKIGTRVWNFDKTKQGTFISIWPEDREDITLVIKWDDGKESSVWHFWCNNMEIVEDEKRV